MFFFTVTEINDKGHNCIEKPGKNVEGISSEGL
jgi:hypothetical protein